MNIKIYASLDTENGGDRIDALHPRQQLFGVLVYFEKEISGNSSVGDSTGKNRGNKINSTLLYINDGVTGENRRTYLPVALRKSDGSRSKFERNEFYDRIKTSLEEWGLIGSRDCIVRELESIYEVVLEEFCEDVFSYRQCEGVSREDVLWGILFTKELLTRTRVIGIFSTFSTEPSVVFDLEIAAGIELESLRDIVSDEFRRRVLKRKDYV